MANDAVTSVDRLKELMLNESGFAFDPRTGLTFNISPTGLDIVRWLLEGLSSAEIVEKVQDEYEIDEHTATRDYENFLDSLQKLSLISLENGQADRPSKT